jgi:phosphoribosylglycinamide formyltransferase 1
LFLLSNGGNLKNIVILISGRGSNMEAIIRAAKDEQWPARVAAVISNRTDAEGLAIAASYGIETAVVPSKNFPSRAAFDVALQAEIDRHSPDLLVLAGFMRVLTEPFVTHFLGRTMNIHPSLLPSFRGLYTHRQALEAGVKVHGATVHFVDLELDHGPIIIQATVPVLPYDTEDVLAERVLEQEHIIYPRAVRWFVEGRLTIEHGTVRVEE